MITTRRGRACETVEHAEEMLSGTCSLHVSRRRAVYIRHRNGTGKTKFLGTNRQLMLASTISFILAIGLSFFFF